MTAKIDSDGIDTGGAEAFEQRFFTFQRIAWLLLTVFVLVGLSGYLGRGPLSGATATSQLGDVVEYQHSIRFKTPTAYRLRLQPVPEGAVVSKEARIRISSALLDKLSLIDVQPTPLKIEPHPRGVVLVYEPPIRDAAFTVDLTMEPKALGAVDGEIQFGRDEAPPLALHQFIYP